ncbi:MAG TPA: hypothetical protein VHW60_21480, partial [Caulobacteraceae bacterium]|nr:hypothetical protein [Caulobacteraceae bacterium]
SQSSQAPPDQGSQTGDETRPDDRAGNDGGSGLSPPVPPESGMSRYDIAEGGLYVDVAGAYPQGYAPGWLLNTNNPAQIVTDRYNQLNHGPQGTETLFVRIIDDQGRPTLEFARRSMGACLADIVGLPQVITQTPKRFRLTNFRYAADPGLPCTRKIQPTPWRGALTLSANRDGDLNLSLVLDLAMETGQPWFEFTARDLPFTNRMTPDMAAADLANKQQIAAANAERARQAEAARVAELARLAALPHAGAVYTRQMANYVRQDSLGWASNQLAPGSVGNVRIYEGSVKTGSFVLRAEFKYADGSQGWVLAQYIGGKFNCIQFWDSMTGCRALRTPGQGQQTLANILTAASSSSGSPGQDTQNGQESARYLDWQNRSDADYQQYWAPHD